MPGPIYKDSWSKTPPPSIYDLVRNPQKINQPALPPKVQMGSTKDVLESTQQRLNREILEKWQDNALRLPHETFVVVAQVGKYLFLAIMLPPYIFLYGLPKWLLINVLPAVLVSAKNETIRVGHFFSSLSKRVADLMKGLLEQMIGDSLKFLNRKAREFLKFASQQCLKLIKFTFHALQTPGKWIKKPIDHLKKALKGFAQKSAMAIGKWNDLRKQALKKLSDKGKLFLKSKWKTLHESVIHPVMHWMSQKASRFNSRVKKAAETVVKAIKRPIRKVLDVTQKVSESIKEAVKWPINFVITSFPPFIQWIAPQLNFFTLVKKFKAGVQRTIKKGSEFRKKIKGFVSRGQQFLKKNIARRAQEFFRSSSQFFKKGFFDQFNQKRKSAIQSIKRFFDRIGFQFSKGVKKIIDLIHNWFIGFQNFLIRAVKWFKIQCQTFPKKLWNFLLKSVQMTRLGISKTGYGAYWFLTFLWILFKYGMFLVHELASSIGNSIAVKKQAKP